MANLAELRSGRRPPNPPRGRERGETLARGHMATHGMGGGRRVPAAHVPNGQVDVAGRGRRHLGRLLSVARVHQCTMVMESSAPLSNENRNISRSLIVGIYKTEK